MPGTTEAVAVHPMIVTPGKTFEGIPFLDDATRPKAPSIPGVTPAQRARGRRLALYHRHHLMELAAVRGALDRFLEGTGTVEAVTDGVASLSLTENYRVFGNLCGRQCHLLQMHHDIEEGDLYPRLRQAIGLHQVLDRLSAEHRTVHGLLERIREIVGSIALDPTAERVLALKEVYAVFERVVISHFGYEERELEEAIGYYGAL
ncbi:hemerythrin domain-containing protein [uncultured Methylobacterium sp.]|uniref:hemerythrin domain-containing protein n=1 Tax=uncultured Methylobacterium sp. TaxID=157278 RepID=UPI00261BE847|nr:hemerythrin domain-containing protein [uncultured Methylobacterium sp.]